MRSMAADDRYPRSVLFVLLAALLGFGVPARPVAAASPPNMIVLVTDDMGWRDTGYSGHPTVQTPNLDDMAAQGLVFDYFYAAQQSCSPGRYAILTGRAPFRTGRHPLGNMRPEEVTIARALRSAGYATAHFGKWHVGRGETSPVKMGFDEAVWAKNFYELGARLQVGDTAKFVRLEGDTSVATMALALDFIREQVAEGRPFFIQVSFGSPHYPHTAAPEFARLYADLPRREGHFLGEISGVDAAVGALREELRALEIADDTIVWFTSDNGGITPASLEPNGKGKGDVGVRTVGLLEWPARVEDGRVTSVPAVHMDIYPTLLDIAGAKVSGQPPLDGISLRPLIDGEMSQRPRPIGFMLRPRKGEPGHRSLEELDFVADTQGVWVDGRYKLIVGRASPALPPEVALYDIVSDPAEQTDLAPAQPETVRAMRTALDAWRRSLRSSHRGEDFSSGG